MEALKNSKQVYELDQKVSLFLESEKNDVEAGVEGGPVRAGATPKAILKKIWPVARPILSLVLPVLIIKPSWREVALAAFAAIDAIVAEA